MVVHDEERLYVPRLTTFFDCQGFVLKFKLLSCQFIITYCFFAWYLSLNSLRFLSSCTVLRAAFLIGWHFAYSCYYYRFLQRNSFIHTIPDSEAGSVVQNSDSSVELVSVSAGMPLRSFTRSQIRASSSIPVPVSIRIWGPCTGLAPTSTRILRPEHGAPASYPPRRSPCSRIFSFSQLSSPSSIPITASSPSLQPVQLASLTKRRQSTEDYAPSKCASSK